MIRTDRGWLKGCSALALYLEEMKEDFYDGPDDEGKKTEVTIAPIDSTFILNKNEDCEVWLPQSQEQKQGIRSLKRQRIIQKIKNFFGGM